MAIDTLIFKNALFLVPITKVSSDRQQNCPFDNQMTNHSAQVLQIQIQVRAKFLKLHKFRFHHKEYVDVNLHLMLPRIRLDTILILLGPVSFPSENYDTKGNSIVQVQQNVRISSEAMISLIRSLNLNLKPPLEQHELIPCRQLTTRQHQLNPTLCIVYAHIRNTGSW